MRAEKKRKCSRVMRFWKTVFGIQEPYRTLVDGTFIHNALRMKCNINQDLSELFGAKCIPVVTSCVVDELRRLGPEFIGDVIVAKRFYRLKCGHESQAVRPQELEDEGTQPKQQPISVANCFKEIIGARNPQKLLVASQDTAVIRSMRKAIGVPIVHFHRSQLVLENPSGWTMAEVQKREDEKVNTVPDWEKRFIQRTIGRQDVPSKSLEICDGDDGGDAFISHECSQGAECRSDDSGHRLSNHVGNDKQSSEALATDKGTLRKGSKSDGHHCLNMAMAAPAPERKSKRFKIAKRMLPAKSPVPASASHKRSLTKEKRSREVEKTSTLRTSRLNRKGGAKKADGAAT